MANFKWSLTDAAVARIEKRIAEYIADSDVRDRLRADEIIRHAIEPENFRYERDVIAGLIDRWIHEGKLKWLTADYVRLTLRQNDEYRKAARDVMAGLRALGRLQR